MLTETVDELRSVALAADDATGYFPAMYARVTERIQVAAADGRFGDAERMERFARSFARWYLRSRPVSVNTPTCWKAAFDVADDERLLIVQQLLLGINAHVNHDLPQVVVELAPPRGGLDPLRADFDAVNDILADTLPIVVGDLGRVSRWVNLVTMRGGGKVFNFSLGAARAQAWQSAECLHALDGIALQAGVAELDDVVAALAYLVTRPNRPMSWLVPVARRMDEHDPATVTSSLLGHLA